MTHRNPIRPATAAAVPSAPTSRRHRLSRRELLARLPTAAITGGMLAGGGLVAGGLAMTATDAAAEPHPAGPVVRTGAADLAADGFGQLAGKRIGLVTNHTGRVGADLLADLMHTSRKVKLTAILAPEHGFRGAVEAGATVADGHDAKTGLPVYSLYGDTRQPTPAMLRDIDVLVFDIQDIGVRFYTYISTMGLAMQAAARRRIPFVVLDRPNPLGGVDVSGFVLEPARRSFVGQYPMPIVHGLTVGELARMIKGERWLDGLETLDLVVVPLNGWTRPMRWPRTGLPWVATSPNIPTFDSALAYPGIGIVGEMQVNEGRGTPAPFSQFGAPWLDADQGARDLNALALPGVRFEPTSYTPRSIRDVAEHPRFEGQRIPAIRLAVGDVAAFQPLEAGIAAAAMLQRQAHAKNTALLPRSLAMFTAISGTTRLQKLLEDGRPATDIIAAWKTEGAAFKQRREKYLMY